mgnify:CR=1 FL=1
MTTIGLELCDAGFRTAATDNAEPRQIEVADRNGATEWPGFAFQDGANFTFGRAAEDMWFVHPRRVVHTFWAKLARELLERGEFRLAMRAFYLASLAHLAARNLVSLARFKSNYDYERELRRRAHAFPDLLAVFGDNLSVFERIWYGMHEVNDELVRQFAINVERLKAGG